MIKSSLEFLGLSVALTGLLTFVVFVLCLGPLVVWWLFNYVAPIFNLRQINFFEAGALYILINMLTGGFVNATKSK